MARPRLLDLFCGAGGSAMGYHRAGFDVVGVDIAPQPRYPFEFIQADALALLSELVHDDPIVVYAGPGSHDIWPIDAIHASPPCQDHSTTRGFGGPHGTGWMLQATVDRLSASAAPWVVENVKTAGLPRQDDLFGAYGLELCGCMFDRTRGLLYEARLFQTSFPVAAISHRRHLWAQTKMGRPPEPGECMQVTGHFSDVPAARYRMGLPWMTQTELAQAILPEYTEYIGRQLLDALAVTP